MIMGFQHILSRGQNLTPKEVLPRVTHPVFGEEGA